MKSSRFIFWLSMLMMMALMLAACTSEPIKQQQTSTVEDPPESVEEEEGQTITLVTPDTAMKAPEEKVNIRYIHG